MKLVFATHNQNKFQEVRKQVPSNIELLSLKMIGCEVDIPETGTTLEENARIKADFVTENYGLACFSDDTGLLVNALNGEPGVLSARYAGEQKNADANMNKLLQRLAPFTNRSAQFETVIALNLQNRNRLFKGVVKGSIIKEKKGVMGFGYDPIFVPHGEIRTFAELPLEEKNKISHRGLAIGKLIHFLSNLPTS